MSETPTLTATSDSALAFATEYEIRPPLKRDGWKWVRVRQCSRHGLHLCPACGAKSS